jgi:GTP-binding protein
MLVDSRHGLKANDLAMMDDLDVAAVSYQVVLTKIDKIKKGQLERVMSATEEALKKRPAAFPFVLASSSEKNTGIDDVRGAFASLVDVDQLGYKA